MPKVIFEGEGGDGKTIEVPLGTTFLQASNKAGTQVGSACGGVCACSTCHVYVKEGYEDLSEISEREEDIMDKAFDVRAISRLGCQAQMMKDRTYRAEISRESRKAFIDEHPELRK